MKEFHQILVPTDFSEHSREAIDYARALAEKLNCQLHFLHVLEMQSSPTPVFAGGLALSSRELESREEAEKALHAIRTVGPATCITCEGQPAARITQYAEENNIDLIVMGTHGRTGLQHVLMGSVAETVLRGATCPVMTVRTKN